MKDRAATPADVVIRMSGKDGDPGIPKGITVCGVELPAVTEAKIVADYGGLVRIVVTMLVNSVKIEREGGL